MREVGLARGTGVVTANGMGACDCIIDAEKFDFILYRIMANVVNKRND